MIEKTKPEKDSFSKTYDEGRSYVEKDMQQKCVIDFVHSDTLDVSDRSRGTLWTWAGIMEGWQDFKKKANL